MKSSGIIARILTTVLLLISLLTLASCTNGENYYTKSEVDGFIAELTDALAKSSAEADAKIAELKTAYEAKVAELAAVDAESKATIDSLIAEYEIKAQELANADKANADALAALDAELEAKLADLNAADAANKALIDALTAEYNAKVKELANADKANADALAALDAELEAKLADLNAADAANKALIDALTAEYNAKVKELANADKANADALAALDAELEAKVAELNVAYAANKALIDALTAEYNAKVKELANADKANADALAALDAELEAKISELNAADAANKALIDALTDEYNAKVKELANADKANADALAALDAELEAKITELNAADAANKALIDALTAEYNAKVKELANADKANADALAALDAELEAKVAELNAADAANKALIDALTAEYNAKVKELANADKANADALAALDAELGAKIAELNAADAANKALIDALTAEYNAKVKELANADKANADALAALDAELEAKIADLNAADAANKALIDALTAEYNAKVKELANADKANADALAALDAELEAKIAELNNAITANAAKATALEATLASEIAAVKADYASKIDALSLLITSLQNTDTDNVKRIAQLEAEMNALLSQHVHSFGSLINYSGNANVPCENRLFYRVCSECKVIEWKQGTSEDHLYKANYSTDDEYHWYDCVYCGAVTGKGEHIENDLGHCEYCDMDSVIYSAGSSSANVTGYRAFAKNVIIADTYNGVPVTAIAGNAFRNSDIVSVVIPDNVKTVGTYAFAYCYELQRVVVGKGVTSISNHAFYCSDTLSDITIGENVTSIGNYAFYNCSNLKSITIPKKVTSIGSSAFQYCSALDSITFPDSVTTIGNYAFEYCVGITSIIFGDGISSIGSYAFHNCTGVKSIKYCGTKSKWNNVSKGSYWDSNTGSDTLTYTYGHIQKNVERIDPTCTENGREAGIICETCNEILDGCAVIPMTGHTPGPGTTVVDPTIGVEGTSTSICTVCNAPITVIIPALPGKVWSYDNPENLGIRLVDAQSLVVITPQNDGNRSYVDVGYENPGAITSGEWNLFFEPTTPLSVFDHTKKYVFETDMKISNLVPTSTYAESSAPWFMYLTLTDSTGTSGDNNHIFNVIYFDKLADGSMKLMIDDRSHTEKSACMPYDEWFNIKVIYSTYEASTDVNVEIAINGVTVYTGTKTAIGSDGLLKLDDNIVGFKLKFKSKSNFESFKISLDNSKFQEAHSDSLSITEVIAKGEELADGSHTEEKYYVTGIITEITDAQHGDMYIKDENGNLLYIDNTYSSDGKNRFDAITNKPVVSDIVTVYGVIGISDGEVHIKDGWIVNTRLHDPILADTITFDNTAKRTYFSTDKQVWEENGITVANTKNNSATNILDYSSPVRFYSGSSFAIEYITQMTQIVIKCNTSTFANSLMNSLALDNITVNVSDKTVTIQFVVPTSTFAIDALENQIRIDSIEVYR